MFKQSRQRYHSLRLLLVVSLLLNGLSPCVALAQKERKPVVISFGQPNIWSLEQAHYLLARMHMENLELQAKALTDSDLDPNAINGTRIQILKQLFELGVSFDQSVGFQNQRLVETARFDDTRRRQLITNRDSLRAQSMQLTFDINKLTSDRSQIADATSDQAKQLDAELKRKKDDQARIDQEITLDSDEIQKLGPEPSGTPAAATAPTPSSSPSLPSGLLDKLNDEELKKLLGSDRDPKLNASTMFDNTIQLQYEIISKQLTLLRDEVGPGERLVFLELPQSIYTSPGDGDEKMAQTWWHVNGYTRTDPILRLLLELYQVEKRWYDIQHVEAFKGLSSDFTPCTKDDNIPQNGAGSTSADIDPYLKETFNRFKEEHDDARKRVIDKLFQRASESFARVEQNGARDTNQMVEEIRKMIRRSAASPSGTGQKDKQGNAISIVELRNTPADEKDVFATPTKEDLNRRRVDKIKWELLNLLSAPRPNVCEKSRYSFENGIEFIRLDDEIENSTPADIERRTIRTVDIIPRQSSLNVNDINETVKQTGILAAFKFLFGFAGQANFQRQREQFEQFVHQELYASGFGKGNRDFGWTFGALPGTKRVAPGVRTTYAALVVPDDAESIVLSARGCYFPRKNYQPLDFEDTGHVDWTRENKFNRYNCGDEQTYILPIPGGGDVSNFWVTNVDYQPVKRGEFVTVSVRGNNFSSQIGVLVNGVPLFTTVGLAQPQLMPRKAAAAGAPSPIVASDCVGATGICGRYERIDPEQIVFSFKMPANSEIGIPTMTLVAPGKSVDLNSLPNLIVNGISLGKKKDGKPFDEKLVEDDDNVKFLFGVRPSSVLSITDVQLLNISPNSPQVVALLTGTGFSAADEVYVNGIELKGAAKILKSPNLYRLVFDLTADENLMFTVAQEKEVVVKPIANPMALKINSATVLGYDPPTDKKPNGVMTIRIEGSGFTPLLQTDLEQDRYRYQRRAFLEYVSPGQVIVKLINPEPLSVVTLTNPVTHGSARVVVQKPPPTKDEEKK